MEVWNGISITKKGINNLILTRKKVQQAQKVNKAYVQPSENEFSLLTTLQSLIKEIYKPKKILICNNKKLFNFYSKEKKG
tara:strand:- start:150 stop:389 length:240 start_codon:yes stop_codon:yes gene_type:complete